MNRVDEEVTELFVFLLLFASASKRGASIREGLGFLILPDSGLLGEENFKYVMAK